ncbi:HAD family hydrolase [Fimbriimonas ginsengisoli]|uniref:HAD-superfamily hydrolase, subfamily IA, variant 3 n=1 Tax=Fimbriimonas ginsengisoli Gsoil 348 TaxID=661478 RepID=A0A068NSY0_FIMGI|nr:HAD family phosphatase [Fimbriimonas ginsengisoli]AIE84729.1 HAD-superfamily hydrolase, subfamily IA, variant 3 [Fimbriimonas ginsengisoli Gsoil 348]
MTNQSPRHPYRLVTFDVGGVLIRICHTWQACAREAGVDIKWPAQPEIALTDFPAFDAYQMGAIDLDDYLARLAEWLGCSPEEAGRVHDGILVEPYPGTEELVAELQDRGELTACLSNTNEPHWQAFFGGRFPAVARLDSKMASHLVGINKPDPAIFRLHAETNGVAPEEIVYFDDAPANIEAATEVGFRTLRIDPSGDTVAQMRGFLVDLGVLTPA